MKNNKERSSQDSIRLVDLATIFLKRKWFFIIFFAVVLIAGLLFTFIKTPIYESDSVLKLQGIYYDENLYKYFPEEAIKLGIFAPDIDSDELKSMVLKDVTENIRDEDLLADVSSGMDIDISKEELNALISTRTDSGNGIVRVITTYSDAETVYQINNILVTTYVENSRNEKSGLIDSIISEIDSRLASLEDQSEEKYGEDSKTLITTELDKIKYNLENNRETYTSNIEIEQQPSVPSEAINMDNLKSILVTIFAAVAIGIIAVYIPGVFKSFKKK